jgi:hypothetical protein
MRQTAYSFCNSDVKLGNPHGLKALGNREHLAKARAAARAVNSAMAAVRAEAMREIMGELGYLSANAAANELNRRGIVAWRGGAWSARAVIRLRERLATAERLSP